MFFENAEQIKQAFVELKRAKKNILKKIRAKKAEDVFTKKELEVISRFLDWKAEHEWPYEHVAHHVEQLRSAVYLSPAMKNFARAWMIDIRYGNERPYPFTNLFAEAGGISIERAEKMAAAMAAGEDVAFAGESGGGNLVQSVLNFLSEHGFEASDAGGGGEGGHFGYHCTDEEKDKLIGLLYSKFRKAFLSGLLVVIVFTFDPSFNELMGAEDED